LSEEAKRADYDGGKTGVEEFLLDKCGTSPILMRPNGKFALSDKDCENLYDWSNAGACTPELTWTLSMTVRQLDPRVFDEKKYTERCRLRLSAEGDDNYSAFRAQICEAPAKSQ
jgi:hypothetical protein